jgi:thioesterase domain-containing protein
MIPLAKAMGVGVEVSDDRALVLTAPKEQNKNSLNTAFGGSLVALATLAGYGVVWELMKDEKKADKPVWHIVVKESRAAYRRPVIGDLRAICERPRRPRLRSSRRPSPATARRSSSCAPRSSRTATSPSTCRPPSSSPADPRAPPPRYFGAPSARCFRAWFIASKPASVGLKS